MGVASISCGYFDHHLISGYFADEEKWRPSKNYNKS
jgi:hypothetical protein